MGCKKNEPFSVTVAVFQKFCDPPDRQLCHSFECNCSGVREGMPRGFKKVWNVAEYVGHIHAISFLKTNNGKEWNESTQAGPIKPELLIFSILLMKTCNYLPLP